jgi:uncharacterized protein YqeY
MSLEKTIQADIVSAMKEKNDNKLRTLRAIKTAVMELKTSPTFKGDRDADLSDADLIKLMQKMAKERRDVAKVYADNGRVEMAEKENIEASIIEVYLPQPLSEDEVKSLVVEAMESVGATSMKDMGKVIAYVNAKSCGRADGKTISTMVKKLLN